MTAHDVVNKVRRLVGVKQVGHAGTLDPMACGVLPVAVGKACRLISYLQSDKTYLAGIRLGLTTTTDDIEGDELERSADIPERRLIEEALLKFTGSFAQMPPYYSAVHYQGKRLYE